MPRGEIAAWSSDLGSGIITSPATPGGCWFDVSVMEPVRPPEGATHVRQLGLGVGTRVEFTFEHATQDGLAYRAVRIRPVGEQAMTDHQYAWSLGRCR